VFDQVGLFFNQMYDLERIAGLAQRKKLNWITPLMAPDQDAVQLNRRVYMEWHDRLSPLGVKFAHWLWCEDPTVDAQRADWLVQNYPTDGLVMNAEAPYAGSNRWKAKVLCDALAAQASTAKLPKLLSYEGTPADQNDMDWRTFQKAGFWFGPQAYWNVMSWLTPRLLCDRCYLPNQIHVDWDYRLWIYGTNAKPWGRVIDWTPDANTMTVKNLSNRALYKLTVETKWEGAYRYAVCGPTRELKDSKGKVIGKLLGFQTRDKIVPTIGIYEPNMPTPSDIVTKLKEVPYITGASGYLGDTSQDIHCEAIWQGIQ
jgi:hypothetical protein